MCRDAEKTLRKYENEYGDFPLDDEFERYGIGEHAGWLIGYVDACEMWVTFLEKHFGVEVDRDEYPFID